jgi:hypothetical protein
MRSFQTVFFMISMTSTLMNSERIYNSYTPVQLLSDSTSQCQDSDRDLWSGSSQNAQFYSNIETCTVQGAGSTNLTENVSSCLTSIYPSLSTSCADCFAADVDCGATNCRSPCQDSSSSACQTCLEPCTQTLVACAGTTNLPSSKSSTGSSNGFTIKSVSYSLISILIMFSVYFL